MSADNLVKAQTIDAGSPGGEPHGWMTLGERIRAARLRHGWGSTILDKKAGLSQGITSRYESGERGMGRGGAAAETLRKISVATCVRLEWLVTGEGRMTEESGELEAPLPQRAVAAEQARREGVWPEAIRSRLADPVAEREPRMGAAWWLLQFKSREEEMLEEARARLAEREHPPPRPKRQEPGESGGRGNPEQTQQLRRVERGPIKKS